MLELFWEGEEGLSPPGGCPYLACLCTSQPIILSHQDRWKRSNFFKSKGGKIARWTHFMEACWILVFSLSSTRPPEPTRMVETPKSHLGQNTCFKEGKKLFEEHMGKETPIWDCSFCLSTWDKLSLLLPCWMHLQLLLPGTPNSSKIKKAPSLEKETSTIPLHLN